MSTCIILVSTFKHAKSKRYMQQSSNQNTNLLIRRVAAARELMEETGLDMRTSMHRLVPIDMEAMGVKGRKLHQSKRRYFRLDINDSDSVQDIPSHTGVYRSMC
jgi:hypothetical protein